MRGHGDNMPTNTLSDTGTTTITFDSFTEITDRLDAKSFIVIGLPDDETTIIVQLLSWVRLFIVKFQLINDSDFPGVGDSAADKYADLVDLIKTGGDSEGLLTLKFDREDSTPGDPVISTFYGCVKNVKKRFVAGANTVKIDGSFEFYEGELD